jgi:anthranilate phosphoribosyltransferase
VHGSDGLDEVTTTGATHVCEFKGGQVRSFEVTPEDAGLRRAKLDELRGGTPQENAAALRTVLAGAPGPYRDIVRLNAGAALIVAGRATSLRVGADMAADALDSGRAKATLDKLVAVTNSPPPPPPPTAEAA